MRQVVLHLDVSGLEFFGQFFPKRSRFIKGMQVGEYNFGADVLSFQKTNHRFFESVIVHIFQKVAKIFGKKYLPLVKYGEISGGFGSKSQDGKLTF
ncbi:hypothetical protein EPO05_03990 [Patescibacteria group bacterium]|nr:MAG: hypothetical protein EPO05_03990 [Patescibacteria group bacterium]